MANVPERKPVSRIQSYLFGNTEPVLQLSHASADKILSRVNSNALVALPSYELTSSVNTIDEGQAVTFTLTTANVVDGVTVPYVITGVSSEDINNSPLTDAFTVFNNKATATFLITADLTTEGPETLTMNCAGLVVNVLINDTSKTPTYSLSHTPSIINFNEGDSVTFTLTTTNVPNGTVIPYIITGNASWDIFSSADINNAAFIGDFTVNNNKANVTFNITRDMLTEGAEEMIISAAGITDSVTINDTSLQPTYILTRDKSVVSEGDTVTFRINTSNVGNGVAIPYVITGVTSADIGGAPLTGNFIIDMSVDDITLNITADNLTEGPETLTMTAAGQTVSVAIVDTSLNLAGATYNLTSSVGSVTEGQSVTFTMNTTNVPDDTYIGYQITGIDSADISGASLTGSFRIIGNTANVTFNVAIDAIIEAETMTMTSAGQIVPVVIVNNTSLVPTYTLSSSVNSVDEGGSVVITMTTTNVANGTSIPYTITGISSADITGAPLTGNFVINNNTNSITLNINPDLTTEGPETLTLTASGQTINVTINDTSINTPATYSLISSTGSVTEGNTVTFTMNTTNVPNGTVLGYQITGIDSADISGAPLTGNFTIINNTASVTFNVAIDTIIEAETMTMTSMGQVVPVVIVNDTSFLPTYTLTSSINSVNEGNAVTFTMTTTNVVDGTTVPYTITGVTTSDIDSAPLTGNFTINGNSATLTLNITADLTTEGPETLTVTSGGQIASVIINDTSLSTPTYNLTSSANTVNEGDSVTFAMTTTGVVNGTNIPYTITGIAPADIGGASLTGDFTITNGTASITFNITADASTEGVETMTMTSQGQSVSVTINDTSVNPPTATYTLTSSVASVNEGGTVTFTMTTTNVPNGTDIPFVILTS